jgi:hypothetical protein
MEPKFCVNCIHFHQGSVIYPDWCSGPHIKRSIVNGIRREPLPGARYFDPVKPSSGNYGDFDDSVMGCGEGPARHYVERKIEPKKRGWLRSLFT